MLLIDVAFVESRPTPWREAVDLANMMLCLALRSDPELVYERALRQFTVQEITEAFAATRGLAMPSQLRHMLRAQGRDLHAEFLDAAARTAPPDLHPALQPSAVRAGHGGPSRPAGRRSHGGELERADRPGQHLAVHRRCRLRRAGGAVADGPGGAVVAGGALPRAQAGRLVAQRRQGELGARHRRLRHHRALPGGGGHRRARPVLRPGRDDRGQLRAAGGQALPADRPQHHAGPGEPLLHLRWRLHHRALRLRRPAGATGQRGVLHLRVRHPRPARPRPGPAL